MNKSLIEITEIGPRDGFQNIKQIIPTELKKQVIDQLVYAGLKTIEITSMVSPKAIPQMADSKMIIDYVLETYPHITPIVLVPNVKGAELVYERGIRNISYVVSVSPDHNRANINRTHEESIRDMNTIVSHFPDCHVVLTLATVFGCPFMGATSLPVLLSMIESAQTIGINRITLCDTIGVANPKQTEIILSAIQTHFPRLDIALHMHNTHGMALANSYVGLQMGITRFETAIGGLGGCPFAPGAAGNSGTEDLVNMLHRMHYDTGIDLDKLLSVVELVKAEIEPQLLSSLSRARSYRELDFNYYP